MNQSGFTPVQRVLLGVANPVPPPLQEVPSWGRKYKSKVMELSWGLTREGGRCPSQGAVPPTVGKKGKPPLSEVDNSMEEEGEGLPDSNTGSQAPAMTEQPRQETVGRMPGK